ncbi:caleosin domain containing [Pyrenophora seminiperda CCB06]|uniref:Caleosin domain containing n=1 Tax=Pyrenophora seminiperda CCB06 TaxID=1302712 RepID=A0A3M7MDJ3_9PLEO|nr:caleosin domain containing [Pyrenophora seminiperda CCB06]
MAICINIFSAKATFNFTGNKPAISGLRSAEVVEGERGEDEREQGRSTAAATANSTLVGEEGDSSAPIRTINWLAGVGDICNGEARGGEGEGGEYEYRKADSLRAFSSGYQMAQRQSAHAYATSKPAKPNNHHQPDAANTRRSALRRHCDFWDTNNDGIIYPWDIYHGFRKLGFNLFLCLWAAVTMAFCSSYSTQTSLLPHPFFAIYLDNITRNRHGSTTGAYDLDAELDTRRFDMIFEKYAEGEEFLTWRTMYGVWRGQCCANDWFGWFAGGLEWIAAYVLLWPQDGKMYKDEIRGIYDGTIFWKIAEAREAAQRKRQ